MSYQIKFLTFFLQVSERFPYLCSVNETTVATTIAVKHRNIRIIALRKWSGCHEYQGDIRLYIMLEIDKTHNIDNVQGMKLLDDECIDLTVTSPPYDNLRNYNGFSFDFENVAKELFRVTKKGGVVVWIVSDATIDGSETGTSFKQALYFMQCGLIYMIL